MMYGANPQAARYYVPVWVHPMMSFALMQRGALAIGHTTRKGSTDRIVIDFNNQHPSVVEFSSLAIANAINGRAAPIFDMGIGALEKGLQRTLRRRFSYLLGMDIHCYALEDNAIAIGLEILDRFLDQHAPKANFPNTVRDAFILGTAVRHKAPLHTKDKLLNKQAAEWFGASTQTEGDGIVIDFDRAQTGKRSARAESKGYINRGWRIGVENARRL